MRCSDTSPVERPEQQCWLQKENEDDGSITFSFPKGYRFRGGIEDSPPAQDNETDSGETMVSTRASWICKRQLGLACLLCCSGDAANGKVSVGGSCQRHLQTPAAASRGALHQLS